MTVEQLLRRFPEIPAKLSDEPLLARFAETFDALLKMSRMPANCARDFDAANHYYMKLVGPLSIHGFGLSTRESVLAEIDGLIASYERDPMGFAASLVPGDAVDREVRGPGCD